ncbi:protein STRICTOSIDINE SYNTHASE-LIKE 10-like [Coffea arabica]|uniref:Protein STRICTOSIDINE SYNTHASE-LIKE 10-like n=2 Tax=Coffea TaxID=13442 RepID=A0A6P6XE73_COFAR
MGSKHWFASFSTLLLIAILIYNAGIVSCQIKDSKNFLIYDATGPESIAFDWYGGGPYTGISDGHIIKWVAILNRWVDFAITTPYRIGCQGPFNHVYAEARCGRPLGLSFNQKTGDLYIADAYMGLLAVGPNGGLARPLAKQAGGIPFRFTNDVVVDQYSGIVYFTDTSTRFPRSAFAYVISSDDNTGRPLKYDPLTHQVTVLLDHLMFPNGVALSQNGDSLLVTETTNSRVLRYWLEPSRAGKVDVFAQLPGRPYNIKRNQQGEFWVATNSRDGIFNPLGMIIKLSPEGDILKIIGAGNGVTWGFSSDVNEHNGNLWIGSVEGSRVVRLTLSN